MRKFILVRVHNLDDYCSRFYEITGASFDHMRLTIKKAGGEFEFTPFKAWKMDGRELEKLPFTITEILPFNIETSSLRVIDGLFYDPPRSYSEFDLLIYRREKYNGWKPLTHFWRIQFDSSDEAIEQERAISGAINPRRETLLKRLALKAAQEKWAKIVPEIQRIMNGRYTKEALQEVVAFLETIS